MSVSTPRNPRTSSSPLIQLTAIRHHYGNEAHGGKLTLMQRLAAHPPRSARGLTAYHDDLLFLRAFPDDASVHAEAIRGLSAIARHVHALSPSQRRLLDDSGIVGTVTRHSFSFGIAQWLVADGQHAEVDWSRFENPERLDPLLRLTLTQAEADAFDSGDLSTREWMSLARGSATPALPWLVRSIALGEHPESDGAANAAMVRLLYESLELPLSWRLTNRRATTGNVIQRPICARSAMRQIPADPVAHITTPLPGIDRLDPSDAAAWVTAARAALAARCREVHAITYANHDEVYLADLGEGATLCLIGAARDDRLTLEANYGYVLFSNGVPIGYGGVTPLGSQANTGVNVFEAFRHSEAPMLFAQALRAFRTLFGVTRFIVNPYQFGAGNDEALASGAFWLYDRLGFRPVDAAMRALAARERIKRAENPRHRSTLATLRRLASSDVVLELAGSEHDSLFNERWLVTIARAVTETLAAPDIPSRFALRDREVEDVAQRLCAHHTHCSRHDVSFGFRRLAPVIALVLDEVATWSPEERAALVRLLDAKGGAQERDFVIESREHRRLWATLRRFCEKRDALCISRVGSPTAPRSLHA